MVKLVAVFLSDDKKGENMMITEALGTILGPVKSTKCDSECNINYVKMLAGISSDCNSDAVVLCSCFSLFQLSLSC